MEGTKHKPRSGGEPLEGTKHKPHSSGEPLEGTKHKPGSSRHAKAASADTAQSQPLCSTAAPAAIDAAFAGMLNISSHVGISSNSSQGVDSTSSRCSTSNRCSISNRCSTSTAGVSDPAATCSPLSQHNAAEAAHGHAQSLQSAPRVKPGLHQQSLQPKGDQKQTSHLAHAGTRSVKKKCSHVAKLCAAKQSSAQEAVGNVVGTPLSSLQPNVNHDIQVSGSCADQSPSKCIQTGGTIRPVMSKGLATQHSMRSAKQSKLHISSKTVAGLSKSHVQAPMLTVSPTHLFVRNPLA